MKQTASWMLLAALASGCGADDSTPSVISHTEPTPDAGPDASLSEAGLPDARPDIAAADVVARPDGDTTADREVPDEDVAMGDSASPPADADADAGAGTPYDPCPPAGTPCVIMPFGDSITFGT